VTVRTRVAPSPTGDPHVGTAYIALFNYCFARSHGGQFLLRIEDTDQARSTRQSEDAILASLRWLGLSWDEGPDVGGPHGPYRQSERSAIYAAHAQQLIDAGHAFKCFCTDERMNAVRAEQKTAGGYQGYDGHCISLTPDAIAELEAAGQPSVVRMKVPRDGTCVVKDRLRDDIEIGWEQVDMQILLKSDGLPTYHLANVVDDHLMGITHVLRGEEWISSAPKHLLLYKYFGWEAPELCHLPLLRNPDKSKLSKRKNPVSILYYERMGFLPEALLNYLGQMAWSMPDGEEKFTLATMAERFDLDRISLGGPVFDLDKLRWLNGRYVREDLDDQTFADRAAAWALNRDFMQRLVPLVRPRVQTFSELADVAGFFFRGRLGLTRDQLTFKKLEPEDVLRGLVFAQWRLDALRTWDAATLDDTLRQTAELFGYKLRDFLKPLFVAVSGSEVATPLFETMEILGPDMTRARIREAIDALTDGKGLSGKKADKLQKDFDATLRNAAQ